MKMNKFILTLTATALLPTFVYASTDEVAASFVRDLQRDAVAASPAVPGAEVDPLHIVNVILNKEPDAVLASFDRDMYREPVTATVTVAREADPLDVINVAFRSEPSVIVAGFHRDLCREPTIAPMVVSSEIDPLVIAINTILWSEIVKPVMHAAIADGYRQVR